MRQPLTLRIVQPAGAPANQPQAVRPASFVAVVGQELHSQANTQNRNLVFEACPVERVAPTRAPQRVHGIAKRSHPGNDDPISPRNRLRVIADEDPGTTLLE
jgi:hypothetical protein